MPFDVEGARKEGYSDSEIAGHLANERKFDLRAAKAEGYTDAEVIAHLTAKPAPKPVTGPAGLYQRLGLITPERAQAAQAQSETAIRDMQTRGWGSGSPKVAYDLGGKVTDVTGSPAAGYVANVAAEAVPAVLGGRVAQSAAPLMRGAAESLMQSALKPTLKQLKTGEAATAVRTMLDEGINATAGGVEKIKTRIGDLNDQIADAIASSNARIDKHAVASRLNSLIDDFSKQVNPSSDIKAIENAWTEFITHPELAGKAGIPVQLAQEMKQATYRVLSKKYGQMGGAETEAQKTLARGLKEEIAAAVPEVSALNSRESQLIKTLNVAERRALMDLNKNPMGLSLLAHSPGAWAAFMADKSALFKSLAARMTNAGQERIPQAAGAGLGALVGAQSGAAPDVTSGLESLLRR